MGQVEISKFGGFWTSPRKGIYITKIPKNYRRKLLKKRITTETENVKLILEKSCLT